MNFYIFIHRERFPTIKLNFILWDFRRIAFLNANKAFAKPRCASHVYMSYTLPDGVAFVGLSCLGSSVRRPSVEGRAHRRVLMPTAAKALCVACSYNVLL